MSVTQDRQVIFEEVLKIVKPLDRRQKLMLAQRLLADLSDSSDRQVVKRPAKPISRYGFCGMWKGREEMQDSIAWVRRLRDNEERRNR